MSDAVSHAVEDGSRERTRITEGYLRLLADWMKGELHKPYGSGVFQ